MSNTLLIVLLLILLDFGLAGINPVYMGLNDLNESNILDGSEVVLLAGLQTTPLWDGYP